VPLILPVPHSDRDAYEKTAREWTNKFAV